MSASGGRTRQFWVNFLTFLELLYRPPFTYEGQMWCAIADTRHAYVPNFVLFLSPSVGEKKTIFVVFRTSALSIVANWQQSDKVEHGCTTTNLSLFNGIKIVSVLQRLHGEIWYTFSDVQKCDRQTKKLNVFGCPGGGCNPSPTKLGMVIEDLEHVLSPLKRLVV